MTKYHEQVLKALENNEKNVEKAIIDAYAQALANMKEVILDYMTRYDTLSYAEAIELNRLLALEQQVFAMLEDLYGVTFDNITTHATKMYKDSYMGTFFEIEKSTNLALIFPVVDAGYIQKAIEYPVGGLRLSERLYGKHLNDLKLKVKTSLHDHAMNNRGYQELARSISDISVADYKQALRIARTEGGRLASLAREDSYQEAAEMGINMKKKWLATLDDRTRDLHQALDGEIVEIDEDFEISGYSAPQPRLFGAPEMDINCRCDTITIIEGISPDLRRDQMTGDVIDYATYEEWAEARGGI